jgi:type II secretory pathway pseudopilin PulG
MKRQDGYTFIILMAMIAILAIGLLAAVPVWQTQIRREAEEELIFRGRQYVEAVRLFNRKNPGRFPATVDDLVEARCLRRPFPDPMTKDGEWDLVLAADGGAGAHALQLSLRQLPPGSYTIVLTGPDGLLSAPLIRIR